MDDDSAELRAAAVAPGGPHAVASAWIEAIVGAEDFDTAWALTDDNLRTACVQAWICSESAPEQFADPDEVVRRICAREDEVLWAAFAAWRLWRWRTFTFDQFVGEDINLINVGPEAVAPDVEFVRFTTAPPGDLPAGSQVLAQTLTMRHVDGSWLVAGIGRSLPEPGWPPSEIELGSSSID